MLQELPNNVTRKSAEKKTEIYPLLIKNANMWYDISGFMWFTQNLLAIFNDVTINVPISNIYNWNLIVSTMCVN